MSPEQNINLQENKIENNVLNVERKNENEEINSNLELSKEKLEEKNIDSNLNNNIGFNNIDKINQFFDGKIITENLTANDDIRIENENNNLINETENLINTENTHAVNRKMSENLNSENNANKAPIFNEMKDIAPILEKFEKKKKKKENVPEGPIRYNILFFKQ